MNPVFTSAGGTYTVEFTADNEWRVAVPNTNHYTWSSVTPTSGGAGKNQVIVTALREPRPRRKGIFVRPALRTGFQDYQSDSETAELHNRHAGIIRHS